MILILCLGISLMFTCDACSKGRKLKWYEILMFLLELLMFTSILDNYYK